LSRDLATINILWLQYTTKVYKHYLTWNSWSSASSTRSFDQ